MWNLYVLEWRGLGALSKFRKRPLLLTERKHYQFGMEKLFISIPSLPLTPKGGKKRGGTIFALEKNFRKRKNLIVRMQSQRTGELLRENEEIKKLRDSGESEAPLETRSAQFPLLLPMQPRGWWIGKKPSPNPSWFFSKKNLKIFWSSENPLLLGRRDYALGKKRDGKEMGSIGLFAGPGIGKRLKPNPSKLGGLIGGRFPWHARQWVEVPGKKRGDKSLLFVKRDLLEKMRLPKEHFRSNLPNLKPKWLGTNAFEGKL